MKKIDKIMWAGFIVVMLSCSIGAKVNRHDNNQKHNIYSQSEKLKPTAEIDSENGIRIVYK